MEFKEEAQNEHAPDGVIRVGDVWMNYDSEFDVVAISGDYVIYAWFDEEDQEVNSSTQLIQDFTENTHLEHRDIK